MRKHKYKAWCIDRPALVARTLSRQATELYSTVQRRRRQISSASSCLSEVLLTNSSDSYIHPTRNARQPSVLPAQLTTGAAPQQT